MTFIAGKMRFWLTVLALATALVSEGTSWSLSLHCDDEEIANLPESERYAYLTRDGEMPNLKAQVVGGASSEVAVFHFQITYNRNNRNDVFARRKALHGNQAWDITQSMGSEVHGGNAVLSCTYAGETQSLQFFIRGSNPDVEAIRNYLLRAEDLWYMLYICEQESNFHQFNTRGAFNAGGHDVKHTPNASYDFGFGMFQLTNPVPDSKSLWSWKSNVDSAMALMRKQRAEAARWMDRQRRQAREEYGEDVPVPELRYGEVTFADGGQYTIEDAVAIKAFNGSEKGYFCSWQNRLNKKSGHWKFNEYNGHHQNYVEEVCGRKIR